MATLRAVVGAVAVVASFVTASTATATSLEDCAQRVIRDWYSGGRVDGVYPLPCYRAAIKALPPDVLQYSDAGRAIASALAYARQGKREAARAAARERRQEDASRPVVSEPATRTAAPAKPKPRAKQATPPAAPLRPEPDVPRKLASGPPAAADGSVPYPVIALTALAGVLLVSAAAGWLARRKP
jgi:hypothetical protein